MHNDASYAGLVYGDGSLPSQWPSPGVPGVYSMSKDQGLALHRMQVALRAAAGPTLTHGPATAALHSAQAARNTGASLQAVKDYCVKQVAVPECYTCAVNGRRSQCT